MKRDYAKHNFTRKRSKNNRLLLWLVFLILCTTFIAGLFILNKYRPQSNPTKLLTEQTKTTTTKQIAEKIEAKEEAIAAATKTVVTPKFDFYNILPQKKASKSEIFYELEISYLDNFAAADRLKAELALLGFAASITPVYQHGVQKHLVSIGPYSNKDSANADQQKLKLNKIKSVLKKSVING